MKENKAGVFLKGMCIGGTMLVPGVSGGTMAIVLGIYDRLISSVSNITRDGRKSLAFLLLFGVGGILGMFLFAKPILNLIERYPLPMLYLFIGAVAGGIPLIVKKTQVKQFTWVVPGCIFLGILAVLLLGQISSPAGMSMDGGNWIMMIFAGVVAAVALVLPGISVSYMLLLMGIYDTTMKAVTAVDMAYLLPLGTGLFMGILLTTRILDGAMNNFPTPTYLIILGFMLGSLFEIFPGIPKGWEIAVCGLTFMAGLGSIQLLSFYSQEKREES